MESKLVYRGLRQISDWALRFYSNIQVDGQENVAQYGPLIITSCHHNEILDIATLSVTIPHSRPVCFWAKSTLFKNPLVRAILLSSGSISVARNPNTSPAPAEQPHAGGPGPSQLQSKANEVLFRETFRALDREEVIGVFPEGTSYTEPCIAQVKDGASRAALEYVRWVRDTKGEQTKRLQIVPVGIVYTDKSQYQSRLCVRWGEPIDVEAFAQERISKDGGEELALDSREVIKALTAEIEKRMLKLTINAPDWDTLYTIQMARDILWADDELSSSSYVRISQNLISQFTDPNAAASVTKAREALLKYHSLLYHADISHDSLNAIIPDISIRPSRLHAFALVFRQALISVLHPRFALFLPTAILHLPMYATGWLAGRLFGKRNEEETWAQFKAAFGGLAASAVYAWVTRAIVKGLSRDSFGVLANITFAGLLVPVLESLSSAERWFFAGEETPCGKAKAALGAFGIFYATSFILSRWHDYWVATNYTQLKRLLASLKLFLGILSPRSNALTGAKLAPYTTPYVPPPNPYIKRREGTPEPKPTPRCPSVSSSKLILPLLDARADATRAMWLFMIDSKYLHGLVTAKMRDEAWMQVGPAKRHEF